MINESKIKSVQDKIKAAIAQIEKDEQVKIEFGSCRYNSAYYKIINRNANLEKLIKD